MLMDVSIGSDKVQSSARAAPVVDARGVSLKFQTDDGEIEALANVNLAVAAGEFVSFIGPSGCGKTTLLRVIADLEQPTDGTLMVNGVPPHEARLKRQYGYVFQAPALYPWRTVERNVTLPLEVMGVAKDERRRRAREQLELVNLAGFARKFPWQLSGGMQQRVSIARALSFDPALLLMHEPFGALDEIVRDHLNEQLLRLWDKTGKTVLFVTHSLPEAVFLSTRIVVMSPRPGRVVDVISCEFPRDRTLEIRETPEFLKIAHRVRAGLRAGYSAVERRHSRAAACRLVSPSADPTACAGRCGGARSDRDLVCGDRARERFAGARCVRARGDQVLNPRSDRRYARCRAAAGRCTAPNAGSVRRFGVRPSAHFAAQSRLSRMGHALGNSRRLRDRRPLRYHACGA